jgi:hypothetical protein
MERNKGFADSKIVDFPTTVTTPCAPRLFTDTGATGGLQNVSSVPLCGPLAVPISCFFIGGSYNRGKATRDVRSKDMNEKLEDQVQMRANIHTT